MGKAVLFTLSVMLFSQATFAQMKSPENSKPKLVVMIMIDQFRADYLMRFKSEFLPAQNKSQLGGFNYLMKQGAYYPYAQYDILQSLTGPGHSTILTGAYPYQSGITLNEWYDKKSNAVINCVEDQKHPLIGVLQKEKADGRSPKNLIGSTVGDELKTIHPKSKVISISLKDRASILMGGHRADLAMWFSEKDHRWVTSTHYLKESQLPAWIESINESIVSKSGYEKYKSRFSKPVNSPYGIELTNQAVMKAIDEFKLGQGSETDVLAISYSSHDYVGHEEHINTKQMKEMTLVEDREIAALLNFLSQKYKNKLDDVVIALSADHGVAPNIEELIENKVHAGYLSSKLLMDEIESELNKKFGKLPKGDVWISSHKVFNFFLNDEIISKKKLDVVAVEDEIKKALIKIDGIAYAFSRTDVKNRKLPPVMHERQILKTYFPERSGDVIAIPRPFFLNGVSRNSHMTGYSYDKTVPLIMMGKAFKSGTYPKIVEIVDLAPTLSFILGIVPPSSSEGRVLTESFN